MAVSQQALVIQHHTDLAVAQVCGASDVPQWPRGQWQQGMRSHHVLVITAQLFLDMLTQEMLTLAQVIIMLL
jgi:endoribonuclease Dicer